MSRLIDAIDERLHIKEPLKEMADHPVPEHTDITRHPSAIVYCFGGITAFIALLMLITGIFLLVYYVPSPDRAYDSVQYIKEKAAFGWLIHGIHHWGASLIVITVVLHMLRVFFQGAYKRPRELNWVAGVLLLLIVLGFAFTGYLLPWHQRAYWATVVGTTMVEQVPVIGDFLLRAMRGGENVGAVTLVRFFAIHVAVLPLLGGLLAVFHFLMVRRQGISEPL